MERDPALDALLDLHGEVLFIHERGYWVKFEAWRVETSANRPHGLRYSLTLHAPGGERLLGFDNAHAPPNTAAPGRPARMAHDHRHRSRSVTAYEYEDAGALLADFWNEVDAELRSRGMIS